MATSGSTVAGIIFLVVIFAGIADFIAHPQGSKAAFSGANSILTSGYRAASGGYTGAAPGG